LPAFQDNYLWVIVNQKDHQAVAIDPGCAQTVQAFLDRKQLSLSHILATHHHPDHIGGVAELTRRPANKFPPIEVIGTHTGRIQEVTSPARQGDTIQIQDLSFSVVELPGHTLDHLGFYLKWDEQPDWLFCGDTLFAGGCGRLFEGTHQQMFDSLNLLRKLPDDTLVFCAHEYTLANLRFLSHYAPGNPAIEQELKRVITHREKGYSTVPSTIGHEKSFNLFLNAQSVEQFKDIRQAKDRF
ncbi:MAG: hydroxyacylglutathione hydrolase, partial [Limnobacter sp.]|nr:hydroxyacylglutathione hydrolase [Limnobacter sp.]